MKKRYPSDPHQKLMKKREEINLIDQKLLNLLNKRLRIALAIGRIKKGMGKKKYDPKREREVLKKLSGINQGPLKESDLKEIFKNIMKVCRQSQV